MTASTDTSLVILIVDQGVEMDALEVLEDLGLDHFTKFSDVSGAGTTGRREGDAIWPGLNTVLFILMDSAKIPALTERLHAVRDSYPITPGMKLIVVPGKII